MSDLRTAAQQALEALERYDGALTHFHERINHNKAITALRAALEEPTIKNSLTTGSCIACGNRMTGSPESFVVATAEVGVTAPEGYSPQQVEALHSHKGGDKTSPPLAEPVQDAMHEAKALAKAYENGWNAAKAERVQEPVAWMDIARDGTRLSVRMWSDGNFEEVPLYTVPLQRKPLTEEEIADAANSVKWSQKYHVDFARAIEKAHGIGVE